MTPESFRDFRKSLQLSQSQMARAIGVGGDRTVRKWEEGERDIPGPVETISAAADKFPAFAKWLALRAVK